MSEVRGKRRRVSRRKNQYWSGAVWREIASVKAKVEEIP
jgi:hypothetical protein